jgi:hypothetical protein
MIRFLAVAVSLAAVCGACGPASAAAAVDGDSRAMRPTESLAGEWAFRLDPEGKGIAEKWFDAALPDRIKLPGSTDEAGYGTKNTRPPDFKYLARLVEYTGPAWYQREIEIPAEWKGKRITLYLERCHWESQAWLDGKPLGMQDSLCVPHVYELGVDLAPGKHRLTLRIDNTKKYDVGKDVAHSISEQTQTNWNGVIGRIELRATDPVWIEDVQVYPDVEKKSAKVRVTIGNATGKRMAAQMDLQAVAGGRSLPPQRDVKFGLTDARTVNEIDLPLGDGVPLWDEFSPTPCQIRVWIRAQPALDAKGPPYAATHTVPFGMRKLSVTPAKQFALNGRTIFLRGTLECCIFPLTGYPPMDVDGWLRIIRTAKSYGLNHLRFHSWCPPEAAFEAADQEGFLFHVESPVWVHNLGKDKPRDDFVREEWLRILRAYGNHPSFGLFCVGNELNGDLGYLSGLVKLGQQTDPRHLYTSSTAWSLVPENEYNVVAIRGLRGPKTDHDFRANDAKHTVPVISHEIGQWTVYPNLDEIKKYTGVLRARNFEMVRDDLKARGMLDLAPDFLLATGKLSVLLYKEEMEVLLRTPGHAGFQLLDLHDFPGQGTALIGILDPFWDSKGLVEPDDWRRFCGPTVPLLRMPKRTYTTDETFSAAAEIAHFGPTDLKDAQPVWTLRDEKGAEVAAGSFDHKTLATGNLLPLGAIEAALAKVKAPAKLTVTVAIKGTDIANDWNIWVYPPAAETAVPQGVTVAEAWDDKTKAALEAGGRVLLLPPLRTLGQSVPGSFTPVFWSPIWFPGRGAQTMSILCDPKHPALALFPTEMHTNWQWYDLLQNSRSVILDDAPADYRPIVRMIDNFSRNHKLANLFEAKVGKGRILVCSIDLRKDLAARPAARQMLRSLYAYAASDAFNPQQALDSGLLDKLFTPPASKLRREEPKAADAAVLRIKAAMNVPERNKSFPWEARFDQTTVAGKGFGYSVRGGVWRDAAGASWHSQDNLAVTITCPKGFEGKLYAHFHDWNNLGRTAEVSFQGQDLGTLGNYDGAGVWLVFPVTAKDSEKGKLALSAKPTRANAQITEIVLTVKSPD